VSHPDGYLEDVRRFYDHWSPQFVASFGPTFQAGFLKEDEEGPEDPETSTRLMAERAGIRPGYRVLDAGCGVGGPAMTVASSIRGVIVRGITVSGIQAVIGGGLIADAGLDKQVSILQGDYHQLPFASDSFDAAVMFESIGYSPDRPRLLREVARVVRPGGQVYIKDVFARAAPLTAVQSRDLRAFDQLWHLAGSPKVPEIQAALIGAGCEVVASGPIDNVGNTRFLRAMVDFDPVTIVRVTELGRAFGLKVDDLPVFFGEVIATVGN
jgi:cyclopropane fatty-acyl-phospholipid synthase-like methyltransferase